MILVAIGANLSFENRTPEQTLRAAIERLQKAQGLEIEETSRFYKTAPVPAGDQPDFINGMIRLETDCVPHDLMRLLLETEKEFGRSRREKWGARTLDLDLIDFNGSKIDEVVDGTNLVLPHPRLHERLFVLAPLRDLAPNWVHPETGQSIDEMIDGIEGEQAVESLR